MNLARSIARRSVLGLCAGRVGRRRPRNVLSCVPNIKGRVLAMTYIIAECYAPLCICIAARKPMRSRSVAAVYEPGQRAGDRNPDADAQAARVLPRGFVRRVRRADRSDIVV